MDAKKETNRSQKAAENHSRNDASAKADRTKEAGAATVNAAAEATRHAAESAVEQARQAGERMRERAQEVAQEGFDVQRQAGQRLVERLGQQQRVAAEATTEAAQHMGSGLQEISRLWMGYAEHSLHNTLEMTHSLSRCRTFAEVLEVQTNYLRTSVEDFIQQTAKLSQLTARVTREAIRPVAERVGTSSTRDR